MENNHEKSRRNIWARVTIVIALVVLAVASILLMLTQRWQNEQSSRDANEIYRIGYQIMASIGQGDRKVVDSLSCEGGAFYRMSNDLYETFDGMRAVEVKEVLEVDRPEVVTTIYFDYAGRERGGNSARPRGEVHSQQFLFRYESGRWCVMK